MSENASRLIRKLWQYCNILRDDGLSYPDYVEQLTYLLFLKMADELADDTIPVDYSWRSFVDLGAVEMHKHYSQVLSALGEYEGMLGQIFHNARNKIKDPAKLRLLVVDLIGQTEWTGLSSDVKGDAYEGLLEKNARDTKSGAGQYFTPRPLINAIVVCIDPQPGEVICDPACGTGGFLISTYDYILRVNSDLSQEQEAHLTTHALQGVELVEEVARLASMNLFLHGVGGLHEHDLPIICADSLKLPPSMEVDVVLTNPPFGVKGSVKSQRKKGQQSGDELAIVRPDFWVATANKQLNFLQHVVSLLKPGGRAAVVVPDNVLFEAGAAAAIRRKLLETCDVHTLLRLPTGLFYAQGVQSNVLFFNKKERETHSDGLLWVYNLREGYNLSLKTNPLQEVHLEEFILCYKSRRESSPLRQLQEATEQRRWKAFPIRDLLQTEHCNLNLTWSLDVDQPTRDDALARLDELSRLISDDLRHALDQLARLTRS